MLQIKHWSKIILNCVLPHTCVLCHSIDCDNLALCIHCQRLLPTIDTPCTICASPITATNIAKPICGNCLHKPPPFDATITFGSYHNPLDYLITQLKFHDKLLYADILGKLLIQKLLAHYINQPKPEIIIPVPLHITRLRERGFNQALEIAKPIAKHLGIPLDTHNCTRIRNTAPQSSLAAPERNANVKRAFAFANQLRYKHVAIFDDVVTTGSTITALCKLLRQNGVAKIDVWCCAKAHFLL